MPDMKKKKKYLNVRLYIHKLVEEPNDGSVPATNLGREVPGPD